MTRRWRPRAGNKHVRCPACVVTLTPALRGEIVKFTMQERRRGTWWTLNGARFATDAAGRTGVEWNSFGRSWINRVTR